MFTLGNMYEKGRGVQQNYAEAVKWYRKSDCTDGYHNLGLMYARGRGVQQNYAEAVKWYRKGRRQRPNVRPV